MKVGITTAISVAGVLVAGTAAYAVNSNVLTTSSSIASSVTVPLVTPIIDAATTASGKVARQSIKVGLSVLNDTTTTYKVGTSGSVVIDKSSGAIVVTNILPAAGWSSEPALVQPNGDVKVYFTSSTARVEFIAHLVDGEVSIRVASEPVAPINEAVTTPPDTTQPPTTQPDTTQPPTTQPDTTQPDTTQPPTTQSPKPSVPFSGDDDDDDEHENENGHDEDDD